MTYLFFRKNTTFALAVEILDKNDVMEFVGYADFTNLSLSIPDTYSLNVVLSELSVHQIWDKPSFKGFEDFTVVNVKPFTDEVVSDEMPVFVQTANELIARQDESEVTGWPGDGSGMDDLADFNANEANDYRDE